MSKLAEFQYKCQRCSLTFYEGITAEKNGQPMLIDIISGSTAFMEGIMGPNLTEKTLHICNTGGVGIAVLVGFRVREDTE